MNAPRQHLAAALVSALLLAGAAQGAVDPFQGTWTTTLHGRDLNGDKVADAFYDSELKITWLADARLADVPPAGGAMAWYDAKTWAENLNFYGVTGWRLPRVLPIDGSAFRLGGSTDASTDEGSALPGLGWGKASELGDMFYVTLGNSRDCGLPPLAGACNTGPINRLVTDVLQNYFWSDNPDQYPLPDDSRFLFEMSQGGQGTWLPGLKIQAWAVHPGDVPSIPEPATSALMLAGLLAAALAAQQRQSAA